MYFRYNTNSNLNIYILLEFSNNERIPNNVSQIRRVVIILKTYESFVVQTNEKKINIYLQDRLITKNSRPSLFQ